MPAMRKSKAIVRGNAVAGAGIPLHPGAEKFWLGEVGLIKQVGDNFSRKGLRNTGLLFYD